MHSRSQQSSANVTSSLSPLSQRNSTPSEHHRCHSASMCPFRWRYSGFVFTQITAHDPVNTFGIVRRHTIKFCLSAKPRPYPSITIRRQLSDNMVYTEKHIRIIRMTPAATILPVIGSSENDVQLRTRHPETTTDEAYSSSPGNNFHRFLAEQTLEYFNLLHGSSKLRGRNDLFSSTHSSETSFLVLLTPEWLPHRVAVQQGRPSLPVQSSVEQ